MAYKNKITQRDPEVSSLAYFLLKDTGICTRCLGRWAEKGHTICHPCIVYWRNQSKSKVKRYKGKVLTIRTA